MSDTPPAGELPAAGRPAIGQGVGVNLPALTEAAEQINAVQSALTGLRQGLQDFSGRSYMLGQGVNSFFDSITTKAKATAEAIGSATGALGGMGTTSPGGTAGSGTGGGGSSWVSRASASAGAAMASAGGGGSGGGTGTAAGGVQPSGFSLTDALSGVGGKDDNFMDNLLMFPLRFMRDQMNTNRQTALTSNTAMGLVGQMTGSTQQGILQMMSRFPGSVMGTQSDMLSLYSGAPQAGALYDMTGGGQNGVRARGYYESIRQAQMMNPGAPVAQLAGMIGGQAGNIQSQQASQMLTGGAFGMVKMGGGQKTLQEWAEGILRWLEGMRGGDKRGKPFDYGELLAQQFPGSNVDAWFNSTGISEDMKQYWWAYALNKTKSTGTTQGTTDIGTGQPYKISPDATSVGWNRLGATTAMTQGQFQLAGTMSGAYANRELSNKWFNEMFGSMLNKVLPSATSQGPLKAAQFMPDTMEQVLMTLLERSGKFGSILGGVVGYGGAFGNDDEQGQVMPDGTVLKREGAGESVWDRLNPFDGDIPSRSDYGDVYTDTGGKGTAGLHPDMRRKINRMMRDNPNVRVTSGLRDNAMQQRLKKRGGNRVSGKPSAHTRGMAADLGPKSEYGWIQQNAGKYGLRSGKSFGEPWHVDMGDDLDLTSGALGVLGGLKDLFTSDVPIEGMAGLTESFFALLTGLMGGGNVDQSNLAFRPDLYADLVGRSRTLNVGGIVSAVKQTAGSMFGGALGGSATATSGGSNAPGSYSGIRTPGDQMGYFQNPDEMTRGAAVAKAMYAAGFRGDTLRNMTAISYRESGWVPNKWVNDADDVGGGLLGINQLPYLSKGMTPPYSRDDILDPYANARIAYDMYNKIIPGRGGYAPWDYPGSPSWQYKVDFDKGSAAVHAAGLGDVPNYGDYYAAGPAGPQGVQFHNSFVIQAGGGSGSNAGIDLRRTVHTLADHLETEMDRRLSMRN